MTDQQDTHEPPNGQHPQAAPAEPAGRILIEFAGPGLAEHTINLEHVAHGQLYAAAWMLDALAHELRAGQSQLQQNTGLVVPGGVLPPRDLVRKFPR